MNLKFLSAILVLDVTLMAGSVTLLWNRIEAAWKAPSIPIHSILIPSQTDLTRTPSPSPSPSPAEKIQTGEPEEEVPTEEDTSSDPASSSKRMKPKKVTFAYSDPAAKRVTIVGDFNQWSPQLLQKQNEMWTLRLELKPGKYAYNFIVDGEMIRDPKNKRSRNAGQKVPSSFLAIQPQ
ncbi:MAG: hypothetical protein HYY07_03860 [Elusimicrobia bacterium]|nr:hypothetical protein [Elusimicrobiota bacterium]